MSISSPKDLFERLSKGVIDQNTTLRQVAVTLYKHVKGIKVGNLMLVGNSGTGKTTIMRTIERVFSEDKDMARFTNIIRLNANLIANDDSTDLETSVIIERLRTNALKMLGGRGTERQFQEIMEHSVVFLDEIDKIRSIVGDKANPRGILAQEALLTLIEGEGVNLSFSKRSEDGTIQSRPVHVDTNRILFICGGAFEGLYDMVYRRVASGEHKDKLVQEYVVGDGPDSLEEKEHFTLQDYVRYEDMFSYGMTPQFLGRFDEIIVLNNLSINGLMRIFVEPADAPYREARKYFQSMGVDLQITREALRALAEAAYENHRLGARALRMVFKRVLRELEFDPANSYLLKEKDSRKVLAITREMVELHS